MYVFDLRAGVGRGGGDFWADDVHSMQLAATCTVSLSALCIGGEGGDGGVLMMLMLFCMMLIAYAEDDNGDDDTCGDNNE